jgi:hypothetical protein
MNDFRGVVGDVLLIGCNRRVDVKRGPIDDYVTVGELLCEDLGSRLRGKPDERCAKFDAGESCGERVA